MLRFPNRSVLALSLLAPLAGAQVRTFDIDPGQSAWTWSGTTSLGPLVAPSGNAFDLSGELDLVLRGGGSPIGVGQLVGAAADVEPDIHAVIPNPIPFLPPLATILFQDLTLSYTSPGFVVAPDGSFSAQVTATVASGQVVISGSLTGMQTVDLTGLPGSPTTVTGTASHDGTTITFDQNPSNVSIDVMDPASGVSASLVLSGTVRATYDCPASLTAGPASVSATLGGTQVLRLDTCVLFTSKPYLVLGSASGTSPGLPIDSVVLPLVFPDPYLDLTLLAPNSAFFQSTLGILDAAGQAVAAVHLPPGLSPALAGVTLNHAYLGFDAFGAAAFASSPAALVLGP